MIIKGNSRSEPQQLARHLGNAKNERVILIETKGTVAQDLRGALLEMDAYGVGTNCQKPLYHAAISPEPPHVLNPEHRAEAIDALDAKLVLVNHARVVVMHEKLGRQHIHVVWSRIDLEKCVRSVTAITFESMRKSRGISDAGLAMIAFRALIMSERAYSAPIVRRRMRSFSSKSEPASSPSR